nr:MAG TPA: HIGH-POTENTIAL IRON-SULFUR PROTEIN sulfur cluster, electron transport [Caudoviricetes sp.]
MANLIDKDEQAREMHRRAQTYDPDRSTSAFARAGLLLLAELLEMAPAELDAEIVVHCGACEHYLPINGVCGVCDLMEGMFRPPVDGYCSRGKRRQGQDADDKEDKNNG